MASKAVNGLLGQFDLRLSRGAGFCVELRGSADSGQPLRDTRAGNHVEQSTNLTASRPCARFSVVRFEKVLLIFPDEHRKCS